MTIVMGPRVGRCVGGAQASAFPWRFYETQTNDTYRVRTHLRYYKTRANPTFRCAQTFVLPCNRRVARYNIIPYCISLSSTYLFTIKLIIEN